jgi:hypothetical protein
MRMSKSEYGLARPVAREPKTHAFTVVLSGVFIGDCIKTDRKMSQTSSVCWLVKAILFVMTQAP